MLVLQIKLKVAVMSGCSSRGANITPNKTHNNQLPNKNFEYMATNRINIQQSNKRGIEYLSVICLLCRVVTPPKSDMSQISQMSANSRDMSWACRDDISHDIRSSGRNVASGLATLRAIVVLSAFSLARLCLINPSRLAGAF